MVHGCFFNLTFPEQFIPRRFKVLFNVPVTADGILRAGFYWLAGYVKAICIQSAILFLHGKSIRIGCLD